MLTLAVGIGSTTAICSVVYGILLRPLPVRDDASLVVAYASDPGIRDNAPISYPGFEEWRSSGAFADVAVLTPVRLDLAGGAAERVDGAHVSGNFFAVLGTGAALGRVLSKSDRQASETPVVISDARNTAPPDGRALRLWLCSGSFCFRAEAALPAAIFLLKGGSHSGSLNRL